MIYINHPNNPNQRINPPNVQIVGIEVDATDGTLDTITKVYSRDHERLVGSDTQTAARDVDARASDAFRRSVTVTINSDTTNRRGFQNNQAAWRKVVEDREENNNNVFVGEQDTGIIKNETMYTYYTLNGKDPKRTKANLYTGSFTVRQNKSGGDNYILKARSYINGIASPVRRVDFRIVNSRQSLSGNPDYRDVNKITSDANG